MVEKADGTVVRLATDGGAQIHPGNFSFTEPVEQSAHHRAVVTPPPIGRVGDRTD